MLKSCEAVLDRRRLSVVRALFAHTEFLQIVRQWLLRSLPARGPRDSSPSVNTAADTFSDFENHSRGETRNLIFPHLS
jgi:hypothetical protein